MARGSVRKLDGAWGYRIDLGPDPATGKRRQASKQGFRTKREAEKALAELTNAAAKGVVPLRSSQTLGDFLDEWIVLQHDRLRPTTLYSYEIAVDRIKRHLAHVKERGVSRSCLGSRQRVRTLGGDEPCLDRCHR